MEIVFALKRGKTDIEQANTKHQLSQRGIIAECGGRSSSFVERITETGHTITSGNGGGTA